MKPKEDFAKIRKLLKWVWENPNSSFYRDKYKKAGVKSWREIKTMEDFRRLPYLTRQDIAMVDPFDRVFLSKDKINISRATSGTSNNKPLIFFNEVFSSNSENVNTHRKVSVEYLKYKKIKRVFFLEPVMVLSMRLQYYSVFKDLCHVFGDIHNLPLSAKIAASTRIDSIMTTSTVLLFFIPYLKKEYDLKKIKHIELGGEYCSKQRLTLLKKQFPNAIFYFHYGSIEAPDREYVCKNQISKNPNIFHWDPNSYPEITEDGELVMTTLLKSMLPVIRYKTGDAIEFKDKPCVCGAKDPVFEILGRTGYDSLRIQGATIDAKAVMNALQDISGIIKEDFKLHVYETVEKETIIPKLVLEIAKIGKSAPKSTKLLEEAISKNLYVSGKFTLADLINKGMFKPLEIKLVEQLPFETKRKYIVSHRD